MTHSEITADSETRALLVAIVDERRAASDEPIAIASSSHLQSDGVPVGTVYGIPVILDRAIPAGAIEIRSLRRGACRVQGFYTPRAA